MSEWLSEFWALLSKPITYRELFLGLLGYGIMDLLIFPLLFRKNRERREAYDRKRADFERLKEEIDNDLKRKRTK